MTHRLDALTAEFNEWLDKTGLPGMSADELYYEMVGVRGGEKSEHITDAAAVTEENTRWVKNFWDRWDAMEAEIRLETNPPA